MCWCVYILNDHSEVKQLANPRDNPFRVSIVEEEHNGWEFGDQPVRSWRDKNLRRLMSAERLWTVLLSSRLALRKAHEGSWFSKARPRSQCLPDRHLHKTHDLVHWPPGHEDSRCC